MPRLTRLILIRLLIAAVLVVLATGQPVLRAVYESDFETGARYHPDDAALLDRWAVVLTSRGETEAAEAVTRRAVALSGWTVARRQVVMPTVSGRDRIVERLRLRDWQAATRLLTAFVAEYPREAEALYSLAILIAPDRPGEARDLLLRAAADPVWGVRAQAAAQAILAGEPGGLSAILIIDREWTLAEYALTRDIGRWGLGWYWLALMGAVQDAQGRDGWPLIELAESQAPADPTVQYAVALHWQRVGDLDRALAAYGKLVAVDSKNPAVAAEIGAIFRAKSDPQAAAVWLELSVALAPNDAGLRRGLGAFYVEEGYQLETSGLTAVREALARFPDDAELNAIYGQALLQLGRRDQAQASLNQALTLDSLNARGRFYLGRLLEQLGDVAGARVAYGRVIQLPSNPFTELAKRALE